MQEIRSSNPPVVTGIYDPNKSWARHHRSLKLGSKLKYLNKITEVVIALYKILMTENNTSDNYDYCPPKQVGKESFE